MASGSVVEACVWLRRRSPWKSQLVLRPPGGSSPSFLGRKLFRLAQASTNVPSTVKQASLFTWFNIRRRRLGDREGDLVVQGLSGWRLGSELRRLRGEFDHILVDSPPHAESDAKTAIREADLALLPCQPNALEVWATRPTLEFAESGRTGAMLVLNRVPARSRAADAIRAEVAASGWPLAATTLGNRQAFAASIGEGRGVAETARTSPAGREIE